MKILKLKIKNVRGIPDLEIEPKGNSFVIYGSNGSGKSAVIDALDFLLTGKISRLSGEGTDGVSLKQHGPHINMVTDLSNVEVIATINVPGIAEEVSILRKMSKPNDLIFDDNYESKLAPVIELLNRGQFVFTRREVLKLITAKSSTRAQEIQKVLKISNIEDIRTNFVKIYNESKREHIAADEALDKGKRDVISITGQTEYDNNEVLKFINEQRVKLGGQEIDKINSSKLQEGIVSLQTNSSSINHKNLEERIQNLKSEERVPLNIEVLNADKILRNIVEEIKKDAYASWNNKRYGFTKEGIKLIRETGECPLCDNEWANGELQLYLQKRINEESERQNNLNETCKTIISNANIVKIKIQQLIELVDHLTENDKAIKSELFTSSLKILDKWDNHLTLLITALADPIENYLVKGFVTEDVIKLYSPETIDSDLDKFEKEVKKLFPEATPEQTAWDSLTKLVERIKIVEEGSTNLGETLLILNRATALGIAYIEARDEVLESLYDKIKYRFVGLYKEMHGEDEKGFDASFTPHDAGLNMEVDFYGRGLHPPHAMHSEGHQDSMGVCLFLALSEHLNTNLIDLIILDDVVMSVDIGHRRAFCHVLSSNFPNKQFIITTHDTTWANQLRGEGLVNRRQMLKFLNWSVNSGPRVHYEADMWSRISKDLENDDVSSASAKLRYGLEEFTRFVCHNFRAKVPYTLDDGGSLGDFLSAAISTYNELLNKAKDAANSWNREQDIELLKKISEKSKETINTASREQWTINKTVHYNDWANLGKEDFLPVVEAFKTLCDSIFSCDNDGCDSVLKVTFDGSKINGVRCNCGNINWNLIKK